MTGSDPALEPLADPLTPAGRALLELLDGHLAEIGAGAAEHDRLGTFPAEVFAKLGDGGVLGATVPVELGGLGVERLHDLAVALRIVARRDASTALALHAQFSRGLTYSYEWRHGGPHAKALTGRLLKLMAAGEPVCGGVKDHHSTVTTLVPDAESDGDWRLTGRTTLVTMAPIAKHIIVLAQIPGRDGEPTRLAAPLLTPDTPGVTVLDNWDGLGMRASGTVDIVFEDCPVPASDVLIRGVLGARGDAALAGQTASSASMLGVYLGVAQAARDFTVAALTRRGTRPSAAVRTLVAEIDTRLYALLAIVATALRTADSVHLGEASGERGHRMMLPFQYAKLMVNRLAPAIVDDCVTIVGGAAYTATHPLSRCARDVRAGLFMQPYTYGDAVDFLSAQALGLDHESDYMSARAARK